MDDTVQRIAAHLVSRLCSNRLHYSAILKAIIVTFIRTTGTMVPTKRRNAYSCLVMLEIGLELGGQLFWAKQVSKPPRSAERVR